MIVSSILAMYLAHIEMACWRSAARMVAATRSTLPAARHHGPDQDDRRPTPFHIRIVHDLHLAGHEAPALASPSAPLPLPACDQPAGEGAPPPLRLPYGGGCAPSLSLPQARGLEGGKRRARDGIRTPDRTQHNPDVGLRRSEDTRVRCSSAQHSPHAA
jgi:hypothetical protein